MPATVSHTTQSFPFGEEMAAQHAGGAYATRYKFTGKELDPQTGYYYYGARYYDPVVSRWLSIDPLAEKYPGLSPYNYTTNNPVMLVDPDGKTADDFIVLSQSGQELRRVQMEGEDIYVKVDEVAFNEASNNFTHDNEDYNTMLSVWSLRNRERNSDEELIAEQTGVRLSITGNMREGSDLTADVTLTFQATFDDGSTFDIDSYEGVAGGYGNGPPENGEYTVDNYQDRSPSGWYNSGMNRDGVGFSFNLNPLFDTGRSLLRIHPDGNNEGTLGCIGLTGNRVSLTSFRDRLNGYLRTRTYVPAVINIINNPNNNGRNNNRIPNVNE